MKKLFTVAMALALVALFVVNPVTAKQAAAGGCTWYNENQTTSTVYFDVTIYNPPHHTNGMWQTAIWYSPDCGRIQGEVTQRVASGDTAYITNVIQVWFNAGGHLWCEGTTVVPNNGYTASLQSWTPVYASQGAGITFGVADFASNSNSGCSSNNGALSTTWDYWFSPCSGSPACTVSEQVAFTPCC